MARMQQPTALPACRSRRLLNPRTVACLLRPAVPQPAADLRCAVPLPTGGILNHGLVTKHSGRRSEERQHRGAAQQALQTILLQGWHQRVEALRLGILPTRHEGQRRPQAAGPRAWGGRWAGMGVGGSDTHRVR